MKSYKERKGEPDGSVNLVVEKVWFWYCKQITRVGYIWVNCTNRSN